MYLSQAISATPSLRDVTRSLLPRRGKVSFSTIIAPRSLTQDNFYPEPFEYDQLPPGLEAYYQQHLHKMFPSEQGTEHSIDVLNVLTQAAKSNIS